MSDSAPSCGQGGARAHERTLPAQPVVAAAPPRARARSRSYVFRVANKDMTYAQQLRDYENAVIQKRFEELSDSEVDALMGEIYPGKPMPQKKPPQETPP